MKAYLRVGDHLFYQIETGNIVCINMDKEHIKSLKFLPSSKKDGFMVISKDEFESAREALSFLVK